MRHRVLPERPRHRLAAPLGLFFAIARGKCEVICSLAGDGSY